MSIVISSLPHVITAEGSYVLKHSFRTNMNSGNAIEIKANNVVIALMGYCIDNQSAGAGNTACGIYAKGYKFCKIMNGRISGFKTGVYLSPGTGPSTDDFSGYMVESITASINSDLGIKVMGLGNIIRNNQVINSRTGIYAGRRGSSTITNNDIHNTEIAIEINSNSGSVVDNNRIGNMQTGGGSFTPVGISIIDSSSVIVKRNAIYNMAHGILYDGYSWGMYIDNVVVCSKNPFVGHHAVAAGTTNYSMPCPKA
jgi:Right handed beta helix region